MSDLWHILVGPAFDGSPTTIKVFREPGRFKWVLTTDDDETEDFVPYPSGFAIPSEGDYEALEKALASVLPGLAVPDFPDLFEEVPLFEYLLSELPPEMLEGVTMHTTSDVGVTVLEALTHHDGSTVAELADRIGISPAMVSNIVEQLLSDGSIAPHPARYSITREGQRRLAAGDGNSAP